MARRDPKDLTRRQRNRAGNVTGIPGDRCLHTWGCDRDWPAHRCQCVRVVGHPGKCICVHKRRKRGR